MEPIIYPEMYRKITKDNIIQRFKVDDQLYILDEVNCTRMYLLIGSERAALIDAGFGFAPLLPLIREVTDKPVTLLLTHGHDDHIYGCYQFEEAYLHENDLELFNNNDNPVQLYRQILARKQSVPDLEDLINVREYLRTDISKCKINLIKEGDRFDLGGLTIEVYNLHGHTKGSVGFYCPERKAIFSGDALMKNHTMLYGQSLGISAPPQEWIRALTKLLTLDIDTVWSAHGDAPADGSLIKDARELLIHFAREGDIEKDKLPPHKGPNIFSDPQLEKLENKITCRFCYKDLNMTYHSGHLLQIREYMKEHNGAVE